ncbi:ATP-binding protein [Aromatoleum evansii]|uniref:ATP-binding protein n=1 Tax=Aromatoleum evansii TaxID=59406 RepID=A0ABZ1AM19_AROEV|nr:ATP-binding protein [Aromatoleum evansii]
MAKPRRTADIAQYASEPFSDQNLATIFRFHPENPHRLITRESGWIEFKQTFSWGNRAEYAKTIAAFANSRGGYFVFGVKDRPRDVVGTDLAKWEATDPTTISEFLNQSLGVEIEWEGHVVEVRGLKVVVLYIREARRKPVIAAQSHKSHLVEGEIYYRYRGRSQRIRYSDLQNLLDEQRRDDQAAWLRVFRQIAKTGIENTALIDLATGHGLGPGSKFYIDQESLSHLKFIREGHFTEKGGAPALRLVGVAAIVPGALIQPERKVLVVRNIHLPEIIEGFLNRTQVENPLQFIKQVCFETSAYLPIYYYANLAGIDTLEKIAKVVEGVNTTSSSRKILLQRLVGQDDLSSPIPGANSREAGKRRREKLQALLNLELSGGDDSETVSSALEAIRCLTLEQIDEGYLNPLLLQWFGKYYTQEGFPDRFRRAIAHLDRLRYRPPE